MLNQNPARCCAELKSTIANLFGLYFLLLNFFETFISHSNRLLPESAPF